MRSPPYKPSSIARKGPGHPLASDRIKLSEPEAEQARRRFILSVNTVEAKRHRGCILDLLELGLDRRSHAGG